MLDRYVAQVRLLLSTLQDIANETVFALKGGTAIDLFYRDMPRLSVDIDLTYLPVADRRSWLKHIGRCPQPYSRGHRPPKPAGRGCPAHGSTGFMIARYRRSSSSTWTARVSPTHGGQEGSAYNGHFGCSCYHPLFVFNQFGDLERCALRAGSVHSAHGWRDVLEPVVARYRDRRLRRYFRGDAAFASPDLYEFLEAEGYKYAIRLKANAVLQESIVHLLTRPVGRPPNHVRRFHASFSYQAGSWSSKRRVVAKIEWHPGQLFPRVGFIVTNLSRPAERVTKFYNGRGTAEQYIKEGKNAINWTRLSCHSFRNNEVRLQLHALAYNLANFMRTLALPKEVEHWSLTTLREKLVKIGAKVVSHGRYVTFQLAAVAVPRALFAEILRLIDGLRPAPLPP